MAGLQNTFLGVAKGKLGDLVFKTRNGRPYIAAAPKPYKKSNSQKQVHVKGKFTFCNNLFSAIGKVYFLKNVWKDAEIEADNYVNKLFKYNYDLINAGFDISNVSLAPTDAKINVEISNAAFDGKELTLAVEPVGIDVTANYKCSIQGIIYLTEPLKEDAKPYAFIPVFSDDQIYKHDLAYEFKSILLGADPDTAAKYGKRFLLINFAIKKHQGEPYMFSNELSGEV